MEIPEITPFFIGLLVVFGLKIINDWLVTGMAAFTKNGEVSKKTPPVSIIICARNESNNLIEFIPKIMRQNYPHFEVVVVNDRSIDNTEVLLNAFANKYENLKITKVQQSELHWAGKKLALTIGLKSATYDHVLLTDADCFPSSNNWIRGMTSKFSNSKKIVLGYGAYQKGSGFLNKLIRGEALLIALQYIGLSKIGIPYMGVGRNLAYHKDLFFDNRGFASHQFMPSGDDDLFINEVANSKNTVSSFSEDSYTISVPEKTFANWMEQKRRHLTTSNRYNLISKSALFCITLVRYLFFSMLFISFFGSLKIIALGLFLINLISLTALHYKVSKKTNSLDLLPWIPICELFLLLFYPFLFIWNTVVSGSPWKNY